MHAPCMAWPEGEDYEWIRRPAAAAATGLIFIAANELTFVSWSIERGSVVAMDGYAYYKC